MAPTSSPSEDESFLDEVFDRIIRGLEEGETLDAHLLCRGQPRLIGRVQGLIELARRIRSDPLEPMPDVPGFTLLRVLGRGGMGTVYLAHQHRLADRLVALKVLPSSHAVSPRARERFRDEVRAVARLSHPNIVAIHDVVVSESVQAFAMEWIDGPTLAEWIQECRRERGGARTKGEAAESHWALVCDLGVSIAKALAAVHAAGLIHRDVKPSNILIRESRTPLLGDFGLARETDATLTSQGQFIGTAAYASPEQLCGDAERIDRRSDIYSLGATLYHAAALQPPFEGHDPVRLRAQIEGGSAPPLRHLNSKIPRDMATVIAKAMDPDPTRRYQTARDFADDLVRVRTHRPILAKRDGLLTRAVKLARRRRGVLISASVGAVLAGLLLSAVGVRLFLVPGWVDQHRTNAHRSLLNQSTILVIFSSAFYNDPGVDGSRPLRTLVPESVHSARDQLRAALFWSPWNRDARAELEVVEAALAGEPIPAQYANDDRLVGLRAYLETEVDEAIAAFDRFEARRSVHSPPDPFVDGALGVMLLASGEPARAYPRLREAVRAHPSMEVLRLYLADAARHCGDIALAERIVDEFAAEVLANRLGGTARVTAGVLAAQGRDEEAEAIYRAAVRAHPLRLEYGQFLESRGRLDEAVAVYASIMSDVPKGRRPIGIFVSAADRWWDAMSPEERRARVWVATLCGAERGGLIDILASRLAVERRRPDGLRQPAPIAPAPQVTSWQTMSLVDAATLLEAGDPALWKVIRSGPLWIRGLAVVGWSHPHLKPALFAMAKAHRTLRSLAP
ncbi:MAG: protein kinase [Phycisphaeraceae bacterium]|nr:protein kinase [Phycisphaeraceae bacterium]